jgi:hypothetical protein
MDAHVMPTTSATAFPLLASIPPHSLDLDTLFEFGLHLLLDGISALIKRSSTRSSCP